MRKISKRKVYFVWCVLALAWAGAWLTIFSIRYGREAAAEPTLEESTLLIVFGVPALALAALWAFLRIRHWIAHRPRQHQAEPGHR